MGARLEKGYIRRKAELMGEKSLFPSSRKKGEWFSVRVFAHTHTFSRWKTFCVLEFSAVLLAVAEWASELFIYSICTEETWARSDIAEAFSAATKKVKKKNKMKVMTLQGTNDRWICLNGSGARVCLPSGKCFVHNFFLSSFLRRNRWAIKRLPNFGEVKQCALLLKCKREP